MSAAGKVCGRKLDPAKDYLQISQHVHNLL